MKMTWNSEFSLANLKEACEVFGLPSSQLKFEEICEKPLTDMYFLWGSKLVSENIAGNFGWGKDLPLEAVISKVELENNRKIVHAVKNLDPIIAIDNHLYDGFGRCLLAYALGEETVLVASFSKIDSVTHQIYLTHVENFAIAESILLKNEIKYNKEEFNKGVIFYFNSTTDKEEAISKIEPLINVDSEGMWKRH